MYKNIFWIVLIVGGILMPLWDLYHHPPKPVYPDATPLEKAFYWHKQSVGAGLYLAENALGDFYYDRNDLERAFYWYEKAAEWGFTDDTYQLAQLYAAQGQYEKAHEWFAKTAENDARVVALYAHPLTLRFKDNAAEKLAEEQEKVNEYRLLAQIHTAQIYHEGEGDIPRDLDKAIEYYELAAANGHETAPYKLGHLYYIRKNYEKALPWLHKAVEKDDIKSINYLGRMYERGRGVPEDHQKAIEYYEMAANLGDSRATYNLGHLYYKQKEYGKARIWMEKAAAQGDETARNYLPLLHGK